ncbi:MAG: hypothetical protein ACR2P1_23805, partial [Pseudomonadales bacterium]
LHMFDRVAQTKPNAGELKTLGDLEAQADERDREDPSFWNLIGNADCRLVIHLINEDLHEHAIDIAKHYSNAKTRSASAREFQSVIEHVTFLSAMINNAAKTTQTPKKGTRTRSSALSKTQAGIEKLLVELKKEQ